MEDILLCFQKAIQEEEVIGDLFFDDGRKKIRIREFHISTD